MAEFRRSSANAFDVNVTDPGVAGRHFRIAYNDDVIFKHAKAVHIYGELQLRIQSYGSNPSWIKGVMKPALNEFKMEIGESGAGMTVELLPNHTIKCTMTDKHGSCGFQGKPSNGTTTSQVFLTDAFLKGEYQLLVKKNNYMAVAELFECKRRSKYVSKLLWYSNC